jgi:sarcosine oxidase, subunit alpha
MPIANEPRRKQLVGLSVAAGEAPLPTGAHVASGAGRARQSQGYVTSSYFSPTLGRPIALGLIDAGLSRMGETVSTYHLGAERRATITNPVALDPEGARLHA